jgi:hypothetical protein
MVNRVTYSFIKCIDIFGKIVRQVGILASIPDVFGRVKIGGICWQPFNRNTLAEAMSQAFCSRPVNRPPIHDQNDTVRLVSQKFNDKSFEFVGANVGSLNIEVDRQTPTFRRNAKGRDCRQSVASIPTIMNRRLAAWRPSPPNNRLEHKATFIKENEATTASARVFLYAATLSDATGQWLFRCVRGLDARVSGNSNPKRPEYAKHDKDDNPHQSACRSPLLRDLESTTRSCNREQQDLLSTTQPTFGVACPRACKADVVAACSLKLSSHHVGRHPASEPPSRAQLRPCEPLGEYRIHRPAMLPHAADAVRVLLGFLLVSCIIISAQASSFL